MVRSASSTHIFLFLLDPDGRRPAALDEGEHSPDFFVSEHVLVGWHGTAIAGRREVLAAVLDDVEQPLICMVPGMAGFIVGWGWEVAYGQPLLPVGLASQVRTMTTGTKAHVYLLAQRHLLGDLGVGLRWLRLG